MATKKKASKKSKPSSAKKTRAKRTPRATAKKAAPKQRRAGAAAKSKPVRAAKKKVVAKKAKPAVRPAVKARPARPRSATGATRRRDATGHIDPQYAAELLSKGRELRDSDADTAFLAKARSGDDFAEELGEEAVAEMTSGEDQRESLPDAQAEAEVGGPFVETRGRDEFARGTDASNPRSATREPFPTT